MKTEILYFSATNTTKSIVKAIARELNGEVQLTDITKPDNRLNYHETGSDLILLAVPIYGERIPRFLYDFFCKIPGKGKLLAVVSVYGNMGFGISLVQFQNLATQNNFRLIAAGAFVGQHTYASSKAPVAYGRPDNRDLQQARLFGKNIQKKLDNKEFTSIVIPKAILPRFITEFPDSGTRFLIQQPRIDSAICNHCGACARKCPTDAIDIKTLQIQESKCLRCYACVKICPKDARLAAFRLPFMAKVFYLIGRRRKENRMFL